MRIPERWLRSFCDPSIGSAELADLLTMSGLEVESREPAGTAFSGVVVAQVLAVGRHPNADKLTVCEVDSGRGKLQVDADILAALEEGTLAGASLDVFPTEPLPPESPLWAHPNVIITPHNAGVSDPRAVAKNILAQIERFERGLPLDHVVDRTAGY